MILTCSDNIRIFTGISFVAHWGEVPVVSSKVKPGMINIFKYFNKNIFKLHIRLGIAPFPGTIATGYMSRQWTWSYINKYNLVTIQTSTLLYILRSPRFKLSIQLEQEGINIYYYINNTNSKMVLVWYLPLNYDCIRCSVCELIFLLLYKGIHQIPVVLSILPSIIAHLCCFMYTFLLLNSAMHT